MKENNMNLYKKYGELIMVTKLVTGEFFVSVMLPSSPQQFISAFPFILKENCEVSDPWFNFTENRIFPFSPSDVVFSKTPLKMITTHYLDRVVEEHPESISFMDEALLQNLSLSETLSEVLH